MTRRSDAADAALSLALFTLLAQAAAGLCLVRAVLLVGVGGAAASAAALTPVSVLALVLLVLGGAAAALHLARPRAARHVLSNLRSSWLSREVLLALLFACVLAVDVGLRLLGSGTASLRAGLGLVAGLLGLALVLAIARVYRLRTVPAWNTWRTPALFLGTALLLGPAIFAGVWAVSARRTTLGQEAIHRGLALLALVAMAVCLVQLLVSRAHFRRFGEEAERPVLSRRLSLGLVGAALLGIAAWMGVRGGAVLAFACAALLLSELLGRWLFYAAHRRIGL